MLGWPVGQGVLPGLWNPAGRGMPARIVHIVGRTTGANTPNTNPTSLIPTGLAPRPSLHGFYLTAKLSHISNCHGCSRMLTYRHRCSDWPAAGWGLERHRCLAGAGPRGARWARGGQWSSREEDREKPARRSWERAGPGCQSGIQIQPPPPPPPPSAQGC